MNQTELRPGVKIKTSIVCARTGLVLLPAGTVLTKEHINNISNREVVIGTREENMREQARIKKVINEINFANIPFGKEQISEKAKQEFNNIQDTAREVYYNKNSWKTSKRIVADIAKNRDLRELIFIANAREVKTVEDNAVNSSIQVASYLNEKEGLSFAEKQSIITATFLSDIGLNEVSDNSTLKNHHINNGNHVSESLKILKQLEPDLTADIVEIVSQHHETLDGQGIPLGIKNINPLAQVVGACYKLNVVISETLSISEILEVFYAYCEKYSPNILKKLFKASFIIPENQRIMIGNRKGAVVQHNHENPDRPIIMVESENDYLGYRYIDLTKDLTSFVKRIS